MARIEQDGNIVITRGWFLAILAILVPLISGLAGVAATRERVRNNKVATDRIEMRVETLEQAASRWESDHALLVELRHATSENGKALARIEGALGTNKENK